MIKISICLSDLPKEEQQSNAQRVYVGKGTEYRRS